MKKIIIMALLAGLITIMHGPGVNAGTLSNSNNHTNNQEKYTLEIIPVDKENLCLIKFIIASDCFVRIKIKDIQTSNEEFLVQDEMSDGVYSIYYKSPEKIIKSSSKCIMEIYDNKREIVYSKELMLPVK